MRSKLPPDFPGRLAELRRLMRRQLGLRSRSLGDLTRRSRRFVPAHIQAALERLARDEELMQHPTLRLMVEEDPHDQDVKLVRRYLLEIDVADRRKGWWLGMAGGLAVNLILAACAIWAVLWIVTPV